MTVTSDPNFSNATRTYVIYVPSTYDSNKAAPLMFWYHGQYGSAIAEAKSSKYTKLGEEHGLISVYPQGKGDGGCGTGWNVGSLDPALKNTCIQKQASQCCYESCQALKACTNDEHAQCRWSTCYDDIAFLKDLLHDLSNELCLDDEHLFSSGGSNGGMMQHWIYQNLPGQFVGIVPVYGLPLFGMNGVPTANKNTWIMAMHDRSDTIIPDQGGWAGGWNYASSDEVYGQWAELKGCESTASPVVTPYDGGAKHIACTEWKNCDTGRVMHCLYDGQHGSWPSEGEDLTWWFWAQTF